MQRLFTHANEDKKAFLELLSIPRNIVITTHQNPDGDAMGSSLGLAGVFLEFGHKVTVITPTDYPKFLKWLPFQEIVINFESNPVEAEQAWQKADLICCLDFSVAERVKGLQIWVEKSTKPILLIDHHEMPTIEATFVYWNQKAAATCQLVYEMLQELDWLTHLDTKAAQCLYVGLLTDTGSFRFPSTTPSVHEVAAGLLSKGANPGETHRRLFDGQSFERLKFLGYALGEKLIYLPDYRVAYFVFSEEELKKFNSQNGDTEGIVNYGLTINGVVMSVIFVEKEGMIKMSFRSVDGFSVSNFAREHFQGGGHHNAAGGRSHASLQETVQGFLDILPKYKEELLEQPRLHS